MVAKKKTGRKQRQADKVNLKASLGAQGDALISSLSLIERLAHSALQHSKVLLPKKKLKSRKVKRKDKKSLNRILPLDQIFPTESDNEADAVGTGETQRTPYRHSHRMAEVHLGDRALNGFVEYFEEMEMDPNSASQKERACVTHFLQQGIVSADPPSKLGTRKGGCSGLWVPGLITSSAGGLLRRSTILFACSRARSRPTRTKAGIGRSTFSFFIQIMSAKGHPSMMTSTLSRLLALT